MKIELKGIYKDLFHKTLYARIIDIDIGDLSTITIHYLGEPEDETYKILYRNFPQEFKYIEAENYHKDSYLQKLLNEEDIRDIIE
jgi:hypothetical protein